MKSDLKKSYDQLPYSSTVLVHIGKCGGRTLRNGIESATQNSDIHVVHRNKPIYREDLKYIIIARNPWLRVFSAFRWRYKLVVSDGDQKDRFEGEYDVLVKYGNLNNLAEALYHEDGSVNTLAQQEIYRIHHIREDISFYLHDLLSRCTPNQILAVLLQENLDNDILRVFGYKNEIRAHSNPVTEENNAISETALSNLMRFFKEDYEALMTLYCWGKVERKIFREII